MSVFDQETQQDVALACVEGDNGLRAMLCKSLRTKSATLCLLHFQALWLL